MIQARDGYLYGMTRTGGQYGFGTIFRTTLYGECSVLYAFSGTPDAAYPTGSLFSHTKFLLSPFSCLIFGAAVAGMRQRSSSRRRAPFVAA